MISPLAPPILKASDSRVQWGSLYAGAASLAIAYYAQAQHKLCVLITPDIHGANQLQRELKFFQPKLDVHLFPDRETLPFDHFSPYEDLISERLYTLHRLAHMPSGIVIVAVPTLMQRLPPREYLTAYSFALQLKDKLEPTQFSTQLTHAGYHRTEQVLTHGEFSIRGAIIDIFPMGSTEPFRIELFDDEVESIRTFDPENQCSIAKLTRVDLLPAREYPITEQSIKNFRQNWRARFSGNPNECPLYQQISHAEPAPGMEYYLPLFFANTETFFDYLPSSTEIICYQPLQNAAKLFTDEVNERYEQLRYDITRPLCEPNELFLSQNDLFTLIKTHPQIHLQPEPTKHINFTSDIPPNLAINNQLKQPLKALLNYMQSFDGRILFCAESTGRREILLELLNEASIQPEVIDSWEQFISSNIKLAITVAAIDDGLVLQAPNIALITETQLFGQQVLQRRLRKEHKIDPDSIIKNLTELRIGSPVVHINHGIGRYLGLQCIETGDIEGEYLTLEYANQDKVYVPVASLNLISRYTGQDSDNAPLNRLGSKQWEKIKQRAQKQIRDVAAELLDIYRKREAAPGYAFNKPGKDFQLFRNAFPFEETPDQHRAINDVIKDMTLAKSMDRLVCGDVGFGKTEVAMQAAFLAVQSGKQIAVLVPTTLLAGQHGHNFKDRFANWPITIEVLSRMQTPKQTQTIIAGLHSGRIDIVIGTHKLLNQNIRFKDLGLLIVDEEQRFGVRHKERIKAMRAHVDILTLTATPIPRTLNMALAGTRDLSLIATPPARRLSVKTFLHEYGATLVREAMLRETMRGGQLYFLHNDVATITATKEKLQQIVPEARIAIAHGQMHERELEQVMSDFYHQKFNVLVCTTIIESGIDIPTANTIIINNANRFGLAQLHQLRGRVGRSHHQAYAYLLIQNKKSLTKDAEKRLEAIANLEDLGAGFHLATHDLEIRGAGELLGEEQSGHIEEIGFSLYMELLEEAVDALKQGKEPVLDASMQAEIEIDLRISAFIPNHFVHDVHTRLTLYKRLANCKHKAQIQALKAEMIDRFGLIPDELQNLFIVTQLKLKAEKLGIRKIEVTGQFGYLHFIEKPNIEPMKIIKMIQMLPHVYQLQGADKLRFKLEQSEPEKRIDQTEALLNKLAEN